MTDDLRIGYSVIGYPAAGKSEAARSLASHTQGILIESGDVVRRGAESHFGQPADDLTSDQLGEYSTQRREEDGGTYVADDIVEQLEAHDEFPRRVAIISGMRDTESTPVFESYFDHYFICWVHATFDTRLERLRERGRQDEDGFTKDYLAKRDGRESMWGTSDLAFESDYTVENEGRLSELDARMEAVASSSAITIQTEEGT